VEPAGRPPSERVHAQDIPIYQSIYLIYIYIYILQLPVNACSQVKLWSLQGELLASEFMHKTCLSIYLSICLIYIYIYGSKYIYIYTWIYRYIDRYTDRQKDRWMDTSLSNHLSISYLSIIQIPVHAFIYIVSLTPFEPQVKLWSLQGELIASEFTHKISLSICLCHIYLYIIQLPVHACIFISHAL